MTLSGRSYTIRSVAGDGRIRTGIDPGGRGGSVEDTGKNAKLNKVRIEVDPGGEEEIVIRCRSVTPDVLALKVSIESRNAGGAKGLALKLGGEEHFIDLRHILFFESADSRVAAHTDKRIYYTDMKLYELEEVLPKNFMRVSKGCVLNLDAVEWTRRELTGPCRVGFTGSTKQAYVSRLYYRPFREKLEETRRIAK